MKKLLLLITSLFIFIPFLVKAQVTVGDSTKQDADGKAELENTAPIDDQIDMESPAFFKIGGALRFNYQFRDWSETHRKQGGDFAFDTWRINVDGQSQGVLISLEYRFYSGYHMFHHGWFGYNVSENTQIQLGINQVPFGSLPYASHSWFFQTPYYIGLEDDYDMGFKIENTSGNWDLHFGFYKTAEPTLSGSSPASARFSYDVVPASIIVYPEADNQDLTPSTPGPAADSTLSTPSNEPDTVLYSANEEVNQFNLRAAYHITPNLEVGLSLQAGGIYNQDVDKTGNHLAGAFHINQTWNNFNLIAEYIYNKYNLPEAPGQPQDKVAMGAYDYPYYVATESQMFVAGLSYRVETNWGPISSLTFYDNFSYMDKAKSSFQDTQQNVLGMMVSAGQLYTYMDIASGKNHPWLGPFENVWNEGLSEGRKDENGSASEPQWHTRFNVNFGYYF